MGQSFWIWTKRNFSTATGASETLLEVPKPKALIMDNANQSNEANALVIILQALNGGKLERILLMGDPQQLSPTPMARRKPFSTNTKMSLLERLFLAGTPHVELRKQFRMHQLISAVTNKAICWGMLIDSPSTALLPGVDLFKDFVWSLALESKTSISQDSCAIIISPSKSTTSPPRSPWGAQKLVGSTSYYNIQTAAITVHLCYLLMAKYNVQATSIMVVACYADQVQFCKALFTGFPAFDGVRVKNVDESVGQEADIVIVDCVVLVWGRPEGNLGYLGAEKRRFNVAMTRARVGRITICHERVQAGPYNTGVWKTLIDDAKRDRCVLPDTYFHRDYEVAALGARFREASASYGREKSIGHHNRTKPRPNGLVERAAISMGDAGQLDHAKRVFAEATGADAHAVAYLQAAQGVVSRAIDQYFEHYPEGCDGKEKIQEVDQGLNSDPAQAALGAQQTAAIPSTAADSGRLGSGSDMVSREEFEAVKREN
ncbi:AAA domain-containing protein, partial [Phyllosticta citrichinensis]